MRMEKLMMDLFLIICLERREQRVCQFKSEISTVGGSDRRFAHNFAVYGIHSRSTNLHNCTVNLLEAHHNSRFQLFVACVNHSVFLHFRFNCTV